MRFDFIKLVIIIIALLTIVYGEKKVVSVVLLPDIKPVSFINSAGEPDGIFTHLIEEIGRLNNFDVKFISKPWAEGMEAVKNGDVDLMPAVARTEERERILGFNNIPVILSWGILAVHEKTKIQGLTELEGKTIGIMRGDQNGKNFIKLISDFNINCSLTIVEKHHDLIPLISNGDLYGGIFFNSFQFNNSQIKPTSIIFSPVRSFFASAPDKNSKILRIIDKQLNLWKEDPNSYYYTCLKKHFDMNQDDSFRLPLWIKYTVFILIILTILFLSWIISMRRIVNKISKELAKSHERLKLAMEATHDGLWDWDVKTGNVHWNANCYKMLGFKPDSFPISFDIWRNSLHPEDIEKCVEIVEKSLFEGNPFAIEFRLKNSNGDWQWILGRGKCVEKDINGKPLRVSGTHIDISERKKYERALSQGMELFKTVADHTYGWEYWQLPDGTMKYTSPSCKRITGYDSLEFMEDSTLVEKIVFKDDFELWQKHFNDCLNKSKYIEFRIVTKSGDVRWIGHECSNVYDDKNTYKGKRVSNRDITELKEIQEHLNQAQKMTAIGQLAGGIAHDFNNMLGAIIGFAELAKEATEGNERLSRYMENILKGSNRAKKLVAQILTFSRQKKSDRKAMNISLVLSEVVDMLKASSPSSVNITINVANNDSVIIGDPTDIHEVVMNICTNAIQAMDEKGDLLINLKSVKIESFLPCVIDKLEPGRYCLIEISDTGPGIPKEKLSHIFEPFYTTKEVGKGTGLGLSVVYGIMASYSGDMNIETSQGEGTSFRLYFKETEEEIAAKKQKKVLNSNKVRHILLVDDEPLLLEAENEILESLGYKVTYTTDSLEALKILQNNSNKFDLLITDQTMPELTGVELSREVLKVKPDLPIILCTGYSTKVNEEEAKRAGISSFAKKPIRKVELSEKVFKIFNEEKIER